MPRSESSRQLALQSGTVVASDFVPPVTRLVRPGSVIDELRTVVTPLLDGLTVDDETMETAVAAIMDGRCDPVEIAAFLTAWRCRGETPAALVGAARAMRARATPIPCRRRGLLDTCGTGGDALHTFNISTATAFVAAAAGIPVAKHGNRSASSRSGSADVLEALGARLDLTPEQTADCVDSLGIGFCFAPRLHAAMKYAAPVRQKLGFRTVFNLLGPLTNPAGAEYQLVGASRDTLAELLASALAKLGAARAVVVCGNNELDEVSLWGTTNVWLVANGAVTHRTWTPETLGLAPVSVDDLRVESPAESAAVIRGVFAGDAGPRQSIILANTAAALWAAQRVETPAEGVALARYALESGDANRLMQAFCQLTQSLAAASP